MPAIPVPHATVKFANGVGFVIQNVSRADAVDVSVDRLFDDTDAHLRATYEGVDSASVRDEPLPAIVDRIRGWTVTFGPEKSAFSMTLVLLYIGEYAMSLTICDPSASAGLIERLLIAAAAKLTGGPQAATE